MNLSELLNTAKSELKNIAKSESPDFRLEQAEYNKANKQWEIVVSYLIEDSNALNGTILPSMFKYKRMYKILKINDNNEVEALLIYNQ